MGFILQECQISVSCLLLQGSLSKPYPGALILLTGCVQTWGQSCSQSWATICTAQRDLYILARHWLWTSWSGSRTPGCSLCSFPALTRTSQLTSTDAYKIVYKVLGELPSAQRFVWVHHMRRKTGSFCIVIYYKTHYLLTVIFQRGGHLSFKFCFTN